MLLVEPANYRHLAKAVGEHGEVIGLDPSADQLAQANCCSDFSNTSLEKGADKTGLPDDSCDAATSTQALEYILMLTLPSLKSPVFLSLEGAL